MNIKIYHADDIIENNDNVLIEDYVYLMEDVFMLDCPSCDEITDALDGIFRDNKSNLVYIGDDNNNLYFDFIKLDNNIIITSFGLDYCGDDRLKIKYKIEKIIKEYYTLSLTDKHRIFQKINGFTDKKGNLIECDGINYLYLRTL